MHLSRLSHRPWSLFRPAKHELRFPTEPFGGNGARALSHTLWRSESWRSGLRPHHPRNGHTLRTIRVPELNTYRVCLA